MFPRFVLLLNAIVIASGEATAPPFPIPFGLSCRVVSVSGSIAQTCWSLPAPPFSLKTCANGTDFSPVVAVNRTYTTYADTHAKKAPYGLILHLYTTPVNASGLTHIECKVTVGTALSHTFVATLYGGTLGLVLSDDATHNSVLLQTFAEYNAYRYGPVFATLPARSTTDRPKLFPILDRFIAGDDDVVNWAAGIAMLAKMGVSGVEMDAYPHLSKKPALEAAGLTFTSGAIYGPPPRVLDTAAELAAWANKTAAGLPSVASGLGLPVRNFAMADEPGFYWPAVMPNTSLSVIEASWQAYLEDPKKRLTPSDLQVGARTWKDVKVSAGRWTGGQASSTLPARKLFYWSTRFTVFDEAAHFARCSAALEKALGGNATTFANFNNFAGRAYVPGPIFNNRAKTDKEAGMLSFDWFSYAAQRGTSLLWTEDWFQDGDAYRWSFLAAKLRGAVAHANAHAAKRGGLRRVEFGGYIVPRAGGQTTHGLLQKTLALVGSGAKALKYYTFGPEYNFPGNCYSEVAVARPYSLQAMSTALSMITAAEGVLFPGERARAAIAIIYPRSSEFWDEQGVSTRDLGGDALSPTFFSSTPGSQS